MQNSELFDLLMADANYPFSGWDFSHISRTGRMVEGPFTWSYASKLLMLLRKAQSLLDMGTGGGEFLSRLQPLPPLTCATEGYAPNVPIARQRLEPLGVHVYEVGEDGKLPFEDNQFDLVINRHEYYDPAEVMRVLKPRHQFITQQVGSTNENDLNALMGAYEYQFTNWTLDYAVKQLQDAGWRIIEQKEDYPIMRFFDVGAIVYYLKAIPWQIPDFSVEGYFDKLVEVRNYIEQHGYIDFHTHRFLIVAGK
ncbi:MAG: class I SAM-dependent methyltransferase [Ktedonobacteraceae bacterium]